VSYPTIDSNLPEGTKVVYHGTNDTQVRWGDCDDPRKHLELHKTYAVHRTKVHSWHTKVFLVDFPSLGFPGAAFHECGEPT
jgi:hypothetical protein